jgi:hypothetical protein
MDNVFVSYVDLPATIRSFVVSNDDSTYTIILNSKLSHEQNLISYIHELEHIKRGDYDKKCSADLIEINAHRA